MEEIIKKAIEGGYECWYTEKPNIQLYSGKVLSANVEKCVLDPLFWQSLGKACGWSESHEEKGMWEDGSIPYWEFVALRFHQINLGADWNQAIKYLESICK